MLSCKEITLSLFGADTAKAGSKEQRNRFGRLTRMLGYLQAAGFMCQRHMVITG